MTLICKFRSQKWALKQTNSPHCPCCVPSWLFAIHVKTGGADWLLAQPWDWGTLLLFLAFVFPFWTKWMHQSHNPRFGVHFPRNTSTAKGPVDHSWLIKCFLLLLLLSWVSRVRLYVTPETAAQQAPLSLGFSRQEHWSGLPFPSPMHESEKWKWSRSGVSNL